jgi:septum formation protein
MKPIILASGSLRRKELLSKAGIQFKVDPSDYIEDLSLDENPQELVRKLSLGKAMAVAKKHPHSIVIGADTVVVFENQILGKPHTKKELLRC